MWKFHLVFDLIEKECNKHLNYIIIICPTLQWNKTCHSKACIKNDDKVWFIEPKGIIRRTLRCNKIVFEKVNGLYYWIEKLSQLLVCSETLFIIDDIIADKGLHKRRLSQVDILSIIYGYWHSLILPYQKNQGGRPRQCLFGIQKKGQMLKRYMMKTMCWRVMN